MQQPINRPDNEYLTEAEAAAWLRIDPEDFRQFVAMGILPKGIPWGKKPGVNHRWPWMDVIAVGHLISRGHIRLPGSDEEKAREGTR